MFHVSRNGRKLGTTEPQLIQSLEETVRSVLPSTWSVTVERSVVLSAGSARTHEMDALLTLRAPDGTSSVVLVECKNRIVVPRDVAAIARQIDAFTRAAVNKGMRIAGRMLAAPFVSPTTRAQLDGHQMGWFDVTGNLRLRLDDPVVVIDRVGAERNDMRDPSDRLLKSLRGSAAAKVVLELSETALPVGVRELAVRAGVGGGTSARVLGLLDREAVVDRDEDGVVTTVRKRALIDRWVQDYQVLNTNEVITALDPRGVNHALDELSLVDTRFALTGSAAARAYLPESVTPVSPLVLLSLYAEDPVGLMRQLGLKAVDRGANVMVMRPYDDVVHAKSRVVDGLVYAAPAQVVADLMTGPGRSSEEAEQVLAVLASTEPGWE